MGRLYPPKLSLAYEYSDLLLFIRQQTKRIKEKQRHVPHVGSLLFL